MSVMVPPSSEKYPRDCSFASELEKEEPGSDCEDIVDDIDDIDVIDVIDIVDEDIATVAHAWTIQRKIAATMYFLASQ